MVDRLPRVYDIDWFNDLVEFGRLDLNPPYQRYSVWSKSYKEYFIDTILKNFPAPAIFLHKENLPDTEHIYHVVDGKQRLLSIFEFQDGEFSVSSDHPQFAGLYYDELPDDVRVQFRNYEMPVEIISTDSLGDLREAFDRLNRNVRKLNKQELRHARHDGAFITLMETLAEDPFWSDIGISTPGRIRRMRDVEYVSEIFLLTMHGVLDSSYKTLDKYYAIYDDEEEFPDVDGHRNRYTRCLDMMKRLGTSFLRSSRFSNLSDFYNLWTAFLEYVEDPEAIDYEETRESLESFDDRVTDPDNISPTDQVALQYSDAVRQGANKPANRQLRAEILLEEIIVTE